MYDVPDSKVRVANMAPTWDLVAPGGPHVSPINLAIRDMTDTTFLKIYLLYLIRYIHTLD